MTEERFENAMECFGNVIENTVEGAATIFDKSMEFMWGFRSVRFVGKTLTFLTGAGLMASAVPLNEQGYHKAAKVCLIGGSIVVAAQIVEMLIFRKG